MYIYCCTNFLRHIDARSSLLFVHEDNLATSCNIINDAIRHYGLPGTTICVRDPL